MENIVIIISIVGGVVVTILITTIITWLCVRCIHRISFSPGHQRCNLVLVDQKSKTPIQMNGHTLNAGSSSNRQFPKSEHHQMAAIPYEDDEPTLRVEDDWVAYQNA